MDKETKKSDKVPVCACAREELTEGVIMAKEAEKINTKDQPPAEISSDPQAKDR